MTKSCHSSSVQDSPFLEIVQPVFRFETNYQRIYDMESLITSLADSLPSPNEKKRALLETLERGTALSKSG